MTVNLKNLSFSPTSTCFDDALDLFLLFAKNPRIGPRLVHGICAHANGDTYCHAWVEREGLCYFSAVIDNKKYSLETNLSDFYSHYRVTDDVTKYTHEQILQFPDITTKKSGPWLDRYIELTIEGKKEREKKTNDRGTTDDVHAAAGV